jgi:hypothetical protein
MRRKIIVALTVLLFCHFIVAIAYLLRFPPWRAPDEGAHFAYIQHLHQTGSLPVFYGKEKGTYEAHQPPLYYLTALPFTAPFLKPNELDLAALLAARFVSTLWGAFVVVIAFMLALRLRVDEFPILPVALSSGAFAALLPVHLLVCASAGNDATAGATSALTLFWLCHICTSANQNRRQLLDAGIAGLLSGMALLAKSSNIIFLPLSFLAVLVLSLQANGQTSKSQAPLKKRKAAKQLARAQIFTFKPISLLAPLVVLFIFAVTAGWWLWRNIVLYGDPLAVRAFLEGFKDSPKPSDFLEPGGRYASYGTLSLTTYIMWVAQITLFTWLGIYGEPNEAVKGLARLFEGTEPDWGWVLAATFIGIVAAAAIGVGCVVSCRLCVKALKERKFSLAFAYALPFLVLLLVFLEFVQFNRHFFQAQARYFYPAHSAMAYLFAIGLFRFVPQRWSWHASIICIAVLTFLAALVWVKWVGL